jgi:hypothetical protein
MKVAETTDFVMQSLALSEEVANPNSRTGRLSQATPNFNLVGGSQTEQHLSELSDGTPCQPPAAARRHSGPRIQTNTST